MHHKGTKSDNIVWYGHWIKGQPDNKGRNVQIALYWADTTKTL